MSRTPWVAPTHGICDAGQSFDGAGAARRAARAVNRRRAPRVLRSGPRGLAHAEAPSSHPARGRPRSTSAGCAATCLGHVVRRWRRHADRMPSKNRMPRCSTIDGAGRGALTRAAREQPAGDPSIRHRPDAGSPGHGIARDGVHGQSALVGGYRRRGGYRPVADNRSRAAPGPKNQNIDRKTRR